MSSGNSIERAGGVPAQPPIAITPALWECEVGSVDPEGDLTISNVTVETPDAREAIRQCCTGLDGDDIEWIKVSRVR